MKQYQYTFGAIIIPIFNAGYIRYLLTKFLFKNRDSDFFANILYSFNYNFTWTNQRGFLKS
jgi:hypothetical protein